MRGLLFIVAILGFANAGHPSDDGPDPMNAAPKHDLDSCPSVQKPKLLNSTSGTIAINATHYQEGLDCGWVIKHTGCDSNKLPRIRMEFTEFDTEYWYDFVVLYDGDGVNNKRLGTMSGGENPGAFVTSKDASFVHFHSDSGFDNVPNTYDGFTMVWNMTCEDPYVAKTDHCKDVKEPMIFKSSENRTGILNFTFEDYGHNLDCAWKFVNEDSCDKPYVEFSFSVFSLEKSFDLLTIFDGEEVDENIRIGRFTGRDAQDGPGKFLKSSGKNALFVFNSDSSNAEGQWDGFVASYEFKCGSVDRCGTDESPLVIDSTNHKDPNKPGVFSIVNSDYKDAMTCAWLIKNTNTCDNGKPLVHVQLGKIRTEQDFDVLSIYDGEKAEKQHILGYFSGDKDYADIDGEDKSKQETRRNKYSKDDSILVTFKTDNSKSADTTSLFSGFDFNYTFICSDMLQTEPPKSCSNVHSPKIFKASDDKTGELEFGIEEYSPDLNCWWKFENDVLCPSGDSAVVTLDFLKFRTEPLFDFVSIYEGSTDGPMRTFSGENAWEVPGIYVSNSKTIYLRFYSDNSLGGDFNLEGFKVAYTFGCGKDEHGASKWDCTDSHLRQYMKIESTPVASINYFHHTLPFSMGYPFVIEQHYTDPNPISLIANKTVYGEVVFAKDQKFGPTNDTSNSEDRFCCNQLDMTDKKNDVRGKMAVCERGQCLFVTKSRVVQNHGAIGMLLIDYNDDGVQMGGAPSSDITIPSVSLRKSLGAVIQKLAETVSVRVTLDAYNCTSMNLTLPPTWNPTARPTPKPVTSSPTPPSAKPTPNPTQQGETNSPTTQRPSPVPTYSPTMAPPPTTQRNAVIQEGASIEAKIKPFDSSDKLSGTVTLFEDGDGIHIEYQLSNVPPSRNNDFMVHSGAVCNKGSGPDGVGDLLLDNKLGKNPWQDTRYNSNKVGSANGKINTKTTLFLKDIIDRPVVLYDLQPDGTNVMIGCGIFEGKTGNIGSCPTPDSCLSSTMTTRVWNTQICVCSEFGSATSTFLSIFFPCLAAALLFFWCYKKGHLQTAKNAIFSNDYRPDPIGQNEDDLGGFGMDGMASGQTATRKSLIFSGQQRASSEQYASIEVGSGPAAFGDDTMSASRQEGQAQKQTGDTLEDPGSDSSSDSADDEDVGDVSSSSDDSVIV